MQNAIPLDAQMTAAEVLRRLARHGLWLAPTDAEASRWIHEVAARLRPKPENAHLTSEAALAERTPEALAIKLARNPADFAAAIRRQWYANILWYSRSIAEVLAACTPADPGATLLNVLNLHEVDSRETTPIEKASTAPSDSVVLDGGQPVGVGPLTLDEATAGTPAGLRPPRARGRSRGAPGGTEKGVGLESAPPRVVRGFPRLDAPSYVPAQSEFEVVVGLGAQAQQGVAGGELVLAAPQGVETIPLTVALIADGVDAPNGWSQSLVIAVDRPTDAVARFTLIGRPPSGPEPVHVTMLEARYIRDGTVVGTAARPLVIGPAAMATLNTPAGLGMPWLSQAPRATPVDLSAGLPVDLTIELAEPDGNSTNGVFSCWLRSRHALSVGSGPYTVKLGEDAGTFAKQVVDEMREYGGEDIVDNALESFGTTVGGKLGREVMTAIADVARVTAPNPPSVLIVSSDPYVPWELARLPVPIDRTRPPYLGAQVLLGRWIQDSSALTREDGYPRPPAQPPGSLAVRHMAVMTGQYKLDAGLRALPEAEKEAATLATTYDAVQLPASRTAVKRLLDANLDHNFQQIGGADAVHFAGHGFFDPARADASVLLLSDGRPLFSNLFLSAKYGGPQQPLMFLNACMIGIGGKMLGDSAGFPGNCLKGGFGGLLGALWEVDDVIASEVALEFWERALPSSGAQGEAVGTILRDLRGKYDSGAPESTFLAYVYYGHPGLTLRRLS